MEKYNKTVWTNDETYLNETNMNNIENQLEKLTDNHILQEDKMFELENEIKEVANNISSDITYDFEITTELPELDFTTQEAYDIELNENDVLQLEEFVNNYAKGKSILNVVVDNIVLWTFSNPIPNIEMLDETNFSLVLETRITENVTLMIDGTFDGEKYNLNSAMLNVGVGELDIMNNRIEELSSGGGGSGVKVFTERNFQPTEQPSGVYFISDETSTVEGNSGSASIRAGGVFIVANDDEYNTKMYFKVINNEIDGIEGRIKSASGSINKSFYVRFSDFLKPSNSASIYSVYTFSRTPKCTTEPTEDTHLTNKKYVDDAIANIDVGAGGESTSFYRIKTTDYLVDSNNTWNLNFANLLTPILQENLDKPFLLQVDDGNKKSVLFNIFYETPTKDLSNAIYTIYGVYFGSNNEILFKKYTLNIYYTLETGIISVENVQGNSAWNTCATKSYVDTAIANLKAELGAS